MIWRVGSILVFVSIMCMQLDETHSTLLNELVSCQQKLLVDLSKLTQCVSLPFENVTSIVPLLKDIPPECTNLNNVDKCVSGLVANLTNNLTKFSASHLLGDLTTVLNVVKGCITKRIQELGNLNDYFARGCPKTS